MALPQLIPVETKSSPVLEKMSQRYISPAERYIILCAPEPSLGEWDVFFQGSIGFKYLGHLIHAFPFKTLTVLPFCILDTPKPQTLKLFLFPVSRKRLIS